MQAVRIVEMPECKMALSAPGMFGDGNLERFSEWFSTLPRTLWPNDFLYFENGSFRWAYMIAGNMSVPDEFEVIDWPGGLYAVATDVDQQTDKAEMDRAVGDFIEKYGFVADNLRPELGDIITPPAAAAVMGCEQMDYWYPIKIRG